MQLANAGTQLRNAAGVTCLSPFNAPHSKVATAFSAPWSCLCVEKRSRKVTRTTSFRVIFHARFCLGEKCVTHCIGAIFFYFSG
jgi:hypothetical protein